MLVVLRKYSMVCRVCAANFISLLAILFINLANALVNSDDPVVVKSIFETNGYVFLKVEDPRSLQFVYRLMSAKNFGRSFNSTHLHSWLVPVSPEEGCGVRFDNEPQVAGNIALVRRGGCSFVSKAVNAERARATAVIVYDYRADQESYLSMVQDDTQRLVHIPAAFMTGKDGHMIVRQLRSHARDAALVTVPVNVTGTPLHLVHLPPWTLW